MSFYWRDLNPKMCKCGAYAVTSFWEQRDGMTEGRENFCEPCAAVKKIELESNPKRQRKHGLKCHGEFGRSNSDVQSPVSQSIRNWGNKIKARQSSN